MKKYYLIYGLCLIVSLLSCSKDSFNYQQAPVTVDQVDTLIFNTSHYVLNADGKSALYYKLAPSYYVTESKEYTSTIALSWFDRKDYGFFYEEPDGKVVEIENDYLTFAPGTTAKTIRVFARMFGQETRKIEVEVREPWGKEVSEKVIPVVFHVFQNTGTTNTEFVIESIHLNDRISKLNNAFSRLISSGASATDSKIRFELAAHTAQGRPMAIPGMNKIKFGAEKLNPEDFSDFYDEEQHFNWSAFFSYNGAAWDPEKFLNVWILPTGNESLPSYTPDMIERGKDPLKGLTMEEVDKGYVPGVVKCGIVMNYSGFLSTEFNAVIGKYLGLLATSDAGEMTDGDSDYCSDTFLYKSSESKQESKNGINRLITFISDNIMDETTQSITVTNEQAARMHYVLENVPSRKMWKVRTE